MQIPALRKELLLVTHLALGPKCSLGLYQSYFCRDQVKCNSLPSEQLGNLCHIAFEGYSYYYGKIEPKCSTSKARKGIYTLLSLSPLPLTHLYYLYVYIQYSGKCPIY